MVPFDIYSRSSRDVKVRICSLQKHNLFFETYETYSIQLFRPTVTDVNETTQ